MIPYFFLRQLTKPPTVAMTKPAPINPNVNWVTQIGDVASGRYFGEAATGAAGVGSDSETAAGSAGESSAATSTWATSSDMAFAASSGARINSR